MRWQPDPTFYPSPSMAMEAPAEKLAYVALLNPTPHIGPDAIGDVDVDPGAVSCGRIVGLASMPNAGDELPHFGWNARSSCLCPYSPHPHMERRYGHETHRIQPPSHRTLRTRRDLRQRDGCARWERAGRG